MNLRSLAKDTAIYGLSSIIGRFLNYLLVPLYTTKIVAQSGGYGIVTNLYAYTALLLAILTFGMETTLFRFSNKEGEDPKMVYSTALRLVGGIALAFLVIVLACLRPISEAMLYASHPEYVGCMAAIVALDAFQAIMFASLRQKGKALKFMGLKFAFIIPNVLLNLAVFLVLPNLSDSVPALYNLYVHFNYGVGLIFFVNLLCTLGVTFAFGKELKGIGYGFDRKLCRRMLAYSWPLLLLSVVGVLNQVADKILFPWLVPGEEGRIQLGIYGACAKIAMIMALLTQAFRYAYEPIVFNSSRDRNNPATLAEGMEYFIVFSLFAFLAVMFYLPVLKYFIGSSYWEGLRVVPVVMMAEIFMGIYFNLSFWYKLSDRTIWGAVMSFAGAAVMIGINLAFVPRYGYMACAWGGFAGYGTSMLMSWIIGQKKFPVPYGTGKILLFFALAAVLMCCSVMIPKLVGGLPTVLVLAINTVLLAIYAFCAFKLTIAKAVK